MVDREGSLSSSNGRKENDPEMFVVAGIMLSEEYFILSTVLEAEC